VKADKRLGQHFLRDPEVLADIVAIADAERSAGVLEIGPGEGALTAFLVRAGRPVVALEKDPRAVRELRGRFGDGVRIVEGDALDADLGALLPERGTTRPVVVGNLPYNVGSAIYRRLLALGPRVARHVLMLQREVAERIVASPGEKAYGIPTVMTAMAAHAWIVRDVPPEAFVPRPKVRSSVVLIEPFDTPRLDEREARAFDAFLARLFQGRRKLLSKTVDPTAVPWEALGIARGARAEELDPDTLLALFQAGL